MAPSKSHYEALGVSRSATAKQIKSAYIDLVKRHHPDRLVHARAEPGLDLRSINLAYSVLKDPGKRRQYDCELDRRALRRPVLAQRPPPRRRRRLPIAAVAAAIAGAALLGQLVVAGAELGQSGSDIRASAGALVSSAANFHPRTAPDAGQVGFTPQLRRQAANAMGSAPAEAIQLSGRCFARARDESRPASADPCVVFDLAFLYSHQGGPPLLTPPYFDEQNVERRALDALAGFGSAGAAERLDALKAATFNMLLQQVEALSAAEEHRSEGLNAVSAPAAEEQPVGLE